MNGKCERLIETIKLECLRKFIVFGKRHLDHLITEFVTYYNTRRSRVPRDHLPPIRDVPEEVETLRLESICLQALAKNPAERFQSMRELIRAIREFRTRAMLSGDPALGRHEETAWPSSCRSCAGDGLRESVRHPSLLLREKHRFG